MTHIQTLPLLMIFIMSTAYFLATLSNRIWQKHKRKLIFWGGVCLLPLVRLLAMLPFDWWLEMVKEDHAVEWSQVVFLVIAAWYSGKMLCREIKNKNVFLSVFFGAMLIVFVYIAGDEISWGQRLFGIQTPEAWAARNVQGEITLHNDKFFSQFVVIFYMIIGFYGSTSWLWMKKLTFLPKEWRKYLIVPKFLTIYFLPLLLFNIYTNFSLFNVGQLDKWIGYRGNYAEPMEMLWYLGMALWTWQWLSVPKGTKRSILVRKGT